MGFKKHVRKNHGRTHQSRPLNCHICGAEIKVGETYYVQTFHRKYGRNESKPICVSCYDGLFITVE